MAMSSSPKQKGSSQQKRSSQQGKNRAKQTRSLSPSFGNLVAKNIQVKEVDGMPAHTENDTRYKWQKGKERETVKEEVTNTLSPSFDTWISPHKPVPPKASGKSKSETKAKQESLLLELPILAKKEQQISIQHSSEGNRIGILLIGSESQEADHPVCILERQNEGSTTVWSIQDARAQDIAHIQEMQGQDTSVPESLRLKRRYRLYSTKPAYEGQEKSRHRENGDSHGAVQLLYHWADIEASPSGLFGKSFAYTMKMKQSGRNDLRYVLVERPRSKELVVERKEPKQGVSAKMPLAGEDETITVAPGNDPLLLAILLATSGQGHL